MTSARNELLELQSTLILELEKLHINFTKDPKIRKTEDYIQKKLEVLDGIWEKFEDNNTLLEKEKDRTHEYFTKDVFTAYQAYYKKTRDMIMEYGKPKDKNKQDEKTQVDLEKVQEYLSLQRTNFRAFYRVTDNIDIDSIHEKWELEYELKNLQIRWNNIEDLHLKIDNILDGSDVEYQDQYIELETLFRSMNKGLNKKLSSTVHLHLSTPKIDIPTFSGSYTQWNTFLDLFKEAVHNNPALNKVQKMQHLKGKLRGEAERLIQHLHISSDNYESAWKILNHRYDNRQVLFTKHMETLINQPNIQKQSSMELKRLHDTSMECIHGIYNMGIDSSSWDPVFVHLIAKKLDTVTFSDYMEARKSPRDVPDLDEFMEFLEAKFIALEPINKKEKELVPSCSYKTNFAPKFKQTYNSNKPAFEKRNTSYNKTYHVYSKPAITCPICNKNHALYQCKIFENMTPDAKLQAVSKSNICKNCLYVHKYGCNSEKRCKECNMPHNTLLHEAIKGASTSNKQSPPLNTHANHVAGDDDEILLATIQMQLRAADGTYTTMRALLDQGSQTTLITENAAQVLGLKRHNIHASVSGIGTSPNKCKGKVELQCKSLFNNYEFMTEALVMTKVINRLPGMTFKKTPYSHIQHLQLADPDYNISRPVDILLDAKVYAEIIMDGLLKSSPDQPIAQQTKMGWILSGSITRSFNCHVVINNIEEISNYWELEDITETERQLTKDEQFCEDYYNKTTRRLSNGTYEVRLPMKEGFEKQLGLSKPAAVAQYMQLERKLAKNPLLSESYHAFINDYIAMHHMKISTEKRSTECYLPHHGVLKEDSTTTKLRTVYNASQSTSSGYSLNDLMECGPKLQSDLQLLLLSWRGYKYVYTADCEKMYRMIWVHEDDQHLQKIIWRDQHNILREYQLCTVTYGMKAAPFLAIRTLQQLANDDASLYPLAADVLKNKFYVDDLLHGNNSIEEAKQVQQQLINMLRGAGFNLRKWSSNEPSLLADLTHDQISYKNVNINESTSTKALGLHWHPSTDVFAFESKINHIAKQDTKRTMLSDISKLFDPLGWLAPITIKAKIMFQRLWANNTHWDEQLSRDMQQEWNQLRDDLKNINSIRIPRWIGDLEKGLQLHGFSDASEKAYAACVYAKTFDENGKPTVRLIAAKTKLAPQKTKATLPRLELCGAVLLSKLMNKIIKSLQTRDNTPIHGWTDSMVVLGWIHGDTARWKTYVANRVNEIKKIMPPTCWNYVKSDLNPADCATRGMTPTQLKCHCLWWEGPPSLLENLQPSQHTYEPPEDEIKVKKHICTAQIKTSPLIGELINKCSSLSRAVRVMCWVSRFIINARGRPNYNGLANSSFLTATEIGNATKIIIKSVQAEMFSKEIKNIRDKGHVSRKSFIANLNPFLDTEGILRMKGRLQRSNLDIDTKQPIIIPYHAKFTELLIAKAHQTTLHGGVKLTLAHVRNKYWIISGNRAVKKVLRQCTKCIRFSAQKQTQLMGDLPSPRVRISRPFTHTGVDFTGHVDVKANKGRGITTTKGYIAVFICLTIKAIHLELVSDLSTSAFLAAFKRMCARRGTPQHMYSDNGTNFVGAARVLATEYKQALQAINTVFLEDVNKLGVNWHFNVPTWSSAGGLWEAAVKSLKHHLKRVIGDQKLTFEEYSTLLAQIEACLNSRPLCSLTEDPEDMHYLSPGHFLVGGPLLSEPLSDLNIDNIKTRWQMTQKMYKEFWKKWSSDYLHTLQTRCKWHLPTKNIEIDSVVLVKDDNLPPSKWALAKVVDVHPGKDGYVRAVTVKTQNAVLKRPVVKLCPLPVNPDNPHSATPASTTETTTPAKRIRKKPNCFISALTLMIFALIAPSMQQTHKITTLNENKALYFDRLADLQIIKNNWKLIVYHNMSTYWRSVENVENYLLHLENICYGESTCTLTLTQFRHELTELEHYNNILKLQPQQRPKRGLVNGIGTVSNYLFGILDDNFAHKYEKDINIIHQNEHYLQSLLKNQTSILESQNNILQRNEVIMNKQFQIIDEQLKNISNEMHEAHQNAIHIFYFTANAVALDVILSNLRRIQETIINTVTNIYHGRLDIHLLAPEQLQNQLNIISRQVQGQHLTPAVDADNIKELSKILRVKARVTEQYVIIEVKIPLLGTDSYELNKVIPMHQLRKNRYVHITPATEYIAFNLRKDTFMSLTELDLQNCLRYNEQKLLCPLSSPLYELGVDQSICDVKIMNENNKQTYCQSETKDCADRWIKLQVRDTWLFTCCEECKVRILCPSGVATACLQHNGLISIGQDCVLKGDTFTIQGHHDYISKLYTEDYNTGEIPTNSTLNTMVNSSIARMPFVVESHNITLWKLKQQIQELQQQKEITSNDDIHHYTMIYVILAVVIVVIAIGTIWICKQKLREDPRGNLQQQQLPAIVISAPASSDEPGSADKSTSPMAKHRTIQFKTMREETV